MTTLISNFVEAACHRHCQYNCIAQRSGSRTAGQRQSRNSRVFRSQKCENPVPRDTQKATSSMKVVLWEDNVDQLQKNKTYLLKNLKVKLTNKERYLNTSNDNEFTATEETPFKKPLVQYQKGLFDIAPSTISAKIIGIHETSTSLSCFKKKKRSFLTQIMMTLENAKAANSSRCLLCVGPSGTCVFLSGVQPMKQKKSVYHSIIKRFSSLWKC